MIIDHTDARNKAEVGFLKLEAESRLWQNTERKPRSDEFLLTGLIKDVGMNP